MKLIAAFALLMVAMPLNWANRGQNPLSGGRFVVSDGNKSFTMPDAKSADKAAKILNKATGVDADAGAGGDSDESSGGDSGGGDSGGSASGGAGGGSAD